MNRQMNLCMNEDVVNMPVSKLPESQMGIYWTKNSVISKIYHENR